MSRTLETEVEAIVRPSGWTQPDFIREPLHVVTVVFNPLRFKSRWKLYKRFADYIHSIGAVLTTVEVSFGERHSACDFDTYDREVIGAPQQSGWNAEHRYYRLQTDSELWLKENLINLGVSRLPRDWKYVAWIDCDVSFSRPNIVSETIHQLQHYKVVQMFTEAFDLNPDYSHRASRPGFVSYWQKGGDMSPTNGQYYYGGQPGKQGGFSTGYGWACRRDAWNTFGGLLDVCIAGSADWHMAYSLIGELERSIPVRISTNYRAALEEWQWRARRLRKNIGCVSGSVHHYWHGKKIDRQYKSRWSILSDDQFDPMIDIVRDWQGLWQLLDRGDDRSMKLRDDLRAYFRGRNEDSIDF